jgi:hypothetical protein
MDADYKRLCGEIWDALGVPPAQQKGEPTQAVKKIVAAGRNVVETFSGKDKVGWSPSKLRDAIADLMHAVK